MGDDVSFSNLRKVFTEGNVILQLNAALQFYVSPCLFLERPGCVGTECVCACACVLRMRSLWL